MASRSFFVVVPDPTTIVGGISKAQLLQMYDQLTPEADIGLLFRSEDTPDVVLFPEFVTFLWLKPSTGELKFWNGASWQLCFGQATIPDASIDLIKLAVGSGLPGQMIRINIAGNELEWFTFVLADGSVSLSKLAPVTQGDILYAKDGTTLQALNFEDEFITLLNFAQIPVAQLYDLAGTGAANQVLSLPAPAAQVQWAWADTLLRANSVPTSRLNLGGVTNALKLAQVNAAGTDLQYVTLPSGITHYEPSAIAVPAISTITPFEHNLGRVPRFIRAVLVNVTPDRGFVAGQELELHFVQFKNGDETWQSFSVFSDADFIYVLRTSPATLYVANGSDGTFAQSLTEASWQLKINASI